MPCTFCIVPKIDKMAFDWFKRKTKNITTSTEDKKDVPKGLWHQTPTGKVIEHEELKANNYVSPEDGFHVRIGSNEFFSILFDGNKYTERIFAGISLSFDFTVVVLIA